MSNSLSTNELDNILRNAKAPTLSAADALTAAQPYFQTVDGSTPILVDGGSQTVRVRCRVVNHLGKIDADTVLEVNVRSDDTVVKEATVGTGTLVSAMVQTTDGRYLVKPAATGIVDLAIGITSAAPACRVTLRNRGWAATGTVNVG